VVGHNFTRTEFGLPRKHLEIVYSLLLRRAVAIGVSLDHCYRERRVARFVINAMFDLEDPASNVSNLNVDG
jgi:hypothetical protein